MKLQYLIFLTYVIVLGGLAVYIFRTTQVTRESFATGSNDLCMKCMDYFRDVLQFTKTDQIVPYVKRRAQYLTYVLAQFGDFMENGLGNCPIKDKVLSVDDVLRCFPAFMESLMNTCVTSGTSRAECVIVSTMGDQIMKKANECGAQACSVDDFRRRFKEILQAMSRDVEVCASNFANDASPCTKLYGQVILAKTKPADPLNQTIKHENDQVPVTQAEMRKMLGEQTAFMMTQFA